MRRLATLLRRRRPDLLAAGAFLLLAGLFLWRPLITSDILVPADILYQFPPWQALAAQAGVGLPHNDLIGDQVLQNVQWKAFAREAFFNGQVPLWNPWVLSGTPFLAEGQHGALYPLGFFFYLLPAEQAYAWFTALHLFLGALGMYLFLRSLGARWWGALVAGVSFQFTSFLVVSFLWPMILSAAIWLPWLLLLADRTTRCFEPGGQRRDALLWGSLGALVLTLDLLAGHLEISFYVLFTLAAWSAFRLLQGLARDRALRSTILGGVALAAMVAAGFAASAVLLLPFLELIAVNFRAAARPVETVIGFALPVRHLVTFVLPDVFGNPSIHHWFDLQTRTLQPFVDAIDPGGVAKDYPFWGIKNYVEGAGYLGILPLLLAALALVLRRDAVTRFFGGYALVCLLLAFGTPLYAVFWTLVPGFTQLNTPFRWLFPFGIAILVLAGLAADRLFDPEWRASHVHPWQRRAALGILAIAGAATAAGLAVVLGGLLLPGVIGPLLDVVRQSSDLATRAFPQDGSFAGFQWRNLAIASVIAAAGLAVLALAWRRPPWRPGLAIAAAAVIVIDLWLILGSFNTVVPARLLEIRPPAADALVALQGSPGSGRFVTFDREADRPLYPLTWMRMPVQDARGYDTVIIDRYVRFWRLMEEPQGLDASMIHSLVEPESLTSPLLDLMNVRWIVTTQNIGLPGLEEVYRGDGIVVYGNTDALPRAWTVPAAQAQVLPDEAAVLDALGRFDPATPLVLLQGDVSLPGATGPPVAPRPATITRYAPNEVDLAVSAPEPSWLVLADSWVPGWRAFVDGQEVPVQRAFSIFRAIELPAGDHTVTFRYSPDSFRLGAFLSLVGAAAILLALALWAWQRLLMPSQAGLSTTQRVAKNSLTPMAAQLLSRLLDFAFAIVLLRYLGPAEAGNYAFAVFLIGFFLLFVDYGLGTLLTREVARQRQDAERYSANTLTLRIILWVLSMPILAIIVGLYVAFFQLSGNTALAIAIFGLAIIPSAAASSLASLYNAYERMEIPAAVGVAVNLVRITLGVLALLAGYGIVGLAVVSVVASSINAVIFGVLIWRAHFVPRLGFDWHFQREMLGTATPLMFNNFLSTIFFRVDVLLLRAIAGDVAVGYYSTAYKFVDGLNIIPSLFTIAAFPVMSRLAVNERDRLVAAYRFSLKMLIIVSLPIAAGTTLIAQPLVVFFFGEAFAPAGIALQVVIWFLPFSFVNSLTHYVLIAANLQRYLTLAFIGGATFNVVGNLVAIPLYGFVGAAVVTIISEIVLLVPFLWLVARHVGSVSVADVALRPILATVVMTLAILPLALNEVNFFLVALAGGLVYPVALLLFRTVSAADRAILLSLVRRQGATP